MLLKGWSRYLLFILMLIIILSGCANKKTPVEKVYDVLEGVVSKESVFEAQQDPLVSLEKQDKAIYDKIIGLGMKEYDQIVKLSDKALSLADKRKLLIEKETNSIKESEKEFNKVTNLKDQLDDPELKKIANQLEGIMGQRYKTHAVLYENYSKALKYDKELYGMFKNKDLPLEDLEAQVNKLNESYKKIFDANEKFNKLTEQYNAKKLSFYKKAGLKLDK